MKATKKNFNQILEMSMQKPIFLLVYDQTINFQFISNFVDAQNHYENDTEIVLANLNCTRAKFICNEFTQKRPFFLEIFRKKKIISVDVRNSFNSITEKCERLKKSSESFLKNNLKNQKKVNKTKNLEDILFNPTHHYFKNDHNDTEEKLKLKKLSEDFQIEKEQILLKQKEEAKNRTIVICFIVLIVFIIVGYILLSLREYHSPKEE